MPTTPQNRGMVAAEVQRDISFRESMLRGDTHTQAPDML